METIHSFWRNKLKYDIKTFQWKVRGWGGSPELNKFEQVLSHGVHGHTVKHD